MKVFVVGANGQMGRRLTKSLNESDEHQVRAMVRNEEQAQALKQSGTETALANLEGTVESIAGAKAATRLSLPPAQAARALIKRFWWIWMGRLKRSKLPKKRASTVLLWSAHCRHTAVKIGVKR